MYYPTFSTGKWLFAEQIFPAVHKHVLDWFADLLLGLSLLFLVANTVGSGAPEPTPTPMPDYFATAESEIASNQVQNQQTVVALESELASGMAATNAKGAAGVILDVATGEVIAMAENREYTVGEVKKKDKNKKKGKKK